MEVEQREMTVEEFLETSDDFKKIVALYKAGQLTNTQVRVRAANIDMDEEDVYAAVRLYDRAQTAQKSIFMGLMIFLAGALIAGILISQFLFG